MISIISFNKDKYSFVSEHQQHYLDKLKQFTKVNLITLDEIKPKNDSVGEIKAALLQEAKLIEKHLDNLKAKVYVLDVESKIVDSIQIAKYVDNPVNDLVFIIGSSNGLDSEFKSKYECFSFGKITLPHKLCRIILLEQIYRGFCINKNIKYHK